MQELHRSRKEKLGGFTLVELIVVIVILAVLLAILVPSMTQWISKAKNEAAFQECRQAVLAAQTYAIEQYASSKEIHITNADETQKKDILQLAEAPEGAQINLLTMDDEAVQVEQMFYTTASGIRVKYENGAYSLATANLGDEQIRDNVLSTIQKVLTDHFKNTNHQVDSGAVAVSNTCETAYVLAELKKNGLNLTEMDAVTWHYDGNNQLLYWTSQNITSYAVGTEVPVMRYNAKTNTYTIWIAKVTAGDTATGNGKTYPVLRNYGKYTPSTDQENKQTYADALKLLAKAQAEYPAPTAAPTATP